MCEESPVGACMAKHRHGAPFKLLNDAAKFCLSTLGKLPRTLASRAGNGGGILGPFCCKFRVASLNFSPSASFPLPEVHFGKLHANLRANLQSFRKGLSGLLGPCAGACEHRIDALSVQEGPNGLSLVSPKVTQTDIRTPDESADERSFHFSMPGKPDACSHGWATVASALAFWHMGRSPSVPGVTAMLGYEESELDPAIQAEILFESARTEARIAILEILVALGFGVWYQVQGPIFRAVALFCLLTVTPLLVDAALRRKAAARLQGIGPQPATPPSGR